jgi:nitrate reductase delta subunit
LPNPADGFATFGVNPMNETDKYFKIVSLLLQYPNEAYFRALPEIKSMVSGMHDGPRKASIGQFLETLSAGDEIHAQEQYTALFDMSPSTTLNVTYHLWGDGEKRARLLTRLQQEYMGAGLEKQSSELPDFLPLILEFLATVPEAKKSQEIKKGLEGVTTLVERLKPVAPHYSGLLEPLTEIAVKPEKQPTTAKVT